MLPGATDPRFAEQLMRIAKDPDLRRSLYERLGDYCHKCRNQLNSLKLSLYLVRRQPSTTRQDLWAEIDGHYQELERRVDLIQTLCRPMALSRVTLGLELLIEDRREPWTRLMAATGRNLELVPPAERAVVIQVEAFDSNCQQHITPRFTQAEMAEMLEPYRRRLEALEAENKRLRAAAS